MIKAVISSAHHPVTPSAAYSAWNNDLQTLTISQTLIYLKHSADSGPINYRSSLIIDNLSISPAEENQCDFSFKVESARADFLFTKKMAITKQKKREIIDDLAARLEKQKAVVFADFAGLKVKDISDLKVKLRAGGAEFKVAKKTLMKAAFAQRGLDFDPKPLEGQIAMAIGYQDEVVAAKVLQEFSKTNRNLKILGGLLENKTLSLSEVLNLALLPSKAELLAKLAGTLSAPPRNFASVLQGNIRGLVTVLSKIKK